MDISKWEFDFENNRGSKQVHSYVLTKPSYKPKIKLTFDSLNSKIIPGNQYRLIVKVVE